MWCFVKGYPLPHIIWYHKNEVLYPNKYLSLNHFPTGLSELTIIPSNRERDEGVYTCEAKNDVINLINATQSHNITVNIQGILSLYIDISLHLFSGSRN